MAERRKAVERKPPQHPVLSVVPEKIKIRREKGYHTDSIGRCKDRTQFMAFIVGVPAAIRSHHVSRKLKWYAVLHRFASDGKHLGTQALLLGTKKFAHEVRGAESKLSELIKTLGAVKYSDIEVKLFSVRIEGYTFGLVDASVPDEGYQRIDLLPNGLAFFPPWDGNYET